MKVLEQRKKALLQLGTQIKPTFVLGTDVDSSEYTAVSLMGKFPLTLQKIEKQPKPRVKVGDKSHLT